MLDIVGKRTWYMLISLIVMVACIIILAFFGLRIGIDFSSGSILTVSFEQPVDDAALKHELASLGYGTAVVEQNPQGDYLIHTVELSDTTKDELKQGLGAAFGNFTEKGFENVDPVIARETARLAAIGIAASAMGILLYMTWAFRVMPKPFRYGVCGVIALLFNVLVTLGVFSILGRVAAWEINLLFVTGILALIGYAINNTVVIFDRIRENLGKGVAPTFEAVVNYSLIESMGRTLNTTITTLIVIIVLLAFVGVSIQNFSLVLLVGLAVGTFSSIYIAPLLLIIWERGEWGRIFRPGSI